MFPSTPLCITPPSKPHQYTVQCGGLLRKVAPTQCDSPWHRTSRPGHRWRSRLTGLWENPGRRAPGHSGAARPTRSTRSWPRFRGPPSTASWMKMVKWKRKMRDKCFTFSRFILQGDFQTSDFFVQRIPRSTTNMTMSHPWLLARQLWKLSYCDDPSILQLKPVHSFYVYEFFGTKQLWASRSIIHSFQYKSQTHCSLQWFSPQSRIDSHSRGMVNVRLDQVLPVAPVQHGHLYPLDSRVRPVQVPIHRKIKNVLCYVPNML